MPAWGLAAASYWFMLSTSTWVYTRSISRPTSSPQKASGSLNTAAWTLGRTLPGSRCDGMAISPAGHVVPSEVVVRRAVAGDAPPARAAIERAIRGSSRDFYSRSQVEAWAAGGTTDGVLSMIETTVAFVAESNGRIVGFSNLDGAEVDQLYVDPELERTGVARQ